MSKWKLRIGLILAFVMVFLPCIPLLALDLLVSNETNNDYTTRFGPNWGGQTFLTGGDSVTLEAVQLLVFKYSGTPPSAYVSVVGVNATGYPDMGNILDTQSVDPSGWTTNQAGEWVSWNFTGGATLEAATTYAVVFYCPDGDASNRPAWRYQSTNVYSDGTFSISTDSGVIWTNYVRDFTFKVWTSSVSAPTVINTTATDITSTTATIGGNITDTGGENATERGVEWDVDSGAPYSYNWSEEGDFGTGEFTTGISDLPVNTTIYWRAFATNGGGTGYSSESSFDTLNVPPGAPTNFTATQSGLSSVSLNWTVGTGATTTVIRGKAETYPTDTSDGFEVYNGVGTNTTVEGLFLDGSTYYYRAWSENEIGYSADYAETNIGGAILLLVGFLGLAAFFTWLSFRFRQLLVSIVSGLLWFSMSMWVFWTSGAVLGLGENYYIIAGFTFFILSFVPFLAQMNTEIRHEEKGQSWSSFGATPKRPTTSEYDAYKKELYRRTRR